MNKLAKHLLKRIDTKYGTNFLFNQDSFIPFITFDIHIEQNSLNIFNVDDLDKIIFEGNIKFFHNEFYEKSYEVELLSLSVVDLFYHLHLAMEYTEDHQHRYIEGLSTKVESDCIHVYTSCGS